MTKVEDNDAQNPSPMDRQNDGSPAVDSCARRARG
jgi:hypothetical protein